MFLVGFIFLSGVSISLVAAYFSIIGLATMFPGSKEAIVIMGAVLEIGKLVAAVWLHKNWHNAFKFLRFYLLIAVLVLSGITSMGIFGFLSKSHVEHSASIEKEKAIIAQIDEKIERKEAFITQRKDLLSQISKNTSFEYEGDSEVLKRLDLRIQSIKEEESSFLEVQNNILMDLQSEKSKLDEALESSKTVSSFFRSNNFDQVNKNQESARTKIESGKEVVLKKIEEIKKETILKIEAVRAQIDSVQFSNDSKFINPKTEEYQNQIEISYEEISDLENQKFEYGSALRALEVEIGPIKYVIGALQEWISLSVGVEQAVRIIILILIFVFDPLAILLIIAAAITYSNMKTKDLPPDVKAIRNKLLEELEDYLNEGGIVDHFIERSKK
tara:strand:- start:8742 stop:9902 length:1161 start_codon:yes stop_codon:yes gene_type:complete